MYLSELRNRFRTELSQAYPPREIASIFHLLIAHYFELPRTILAMEPQKELSAWEADLLKNALADLKAHRPVQYITGKAHFMEMDLRVTQDVLIPRPETAELVTWIVSEYSGLKVPLRILDAGTGSGCIALGLKQQLTDAEVFGMDISDSALKIARANASTLNLEVRFWEGDLKNPGTDLPKFDVLVSNPPYIPRSEAASMQAHVSTAEPHLALFVPDNDPLLFYKYLCDFALHHLNRGGWMYLESHEQYADAVGRLLEDSGFTDVEVKKDIFGKNRFVRGKWHTPSPDASRTLKEKNHE